MILRELAKRQVPCEEIMSKFFPLVEHVIIKTDSDSWSGIPGIQETNLLLVPF